MQEEIKLLCNRCYNSLTTVVYTEGVYVYPCDCRNEELYNAGMAEGRKEGYEEGHEEGEYYGFDRGREEAESEYRTQIEELEEKLEKYSELIDEEEYNERIGI